MTTAETAKNYATFLDFMIGEYTFGQLQDLANHGADAGWPHITYTRDAADLCDAYEDEITDLVREQANVHWYPNEMSFIGTFTRADMAGTINGFKNLLIWFAAEHYASEIVDSGEYAACDDQGNVLSLDGEYDGRVCKVSDEETDD